jgi:hypothetical protein
MTLDNEDRKWLEQLLASMLKPMLSEQSTAVQHPAGSFLARCADADARRKQKLERRAAQ